jgi:sigma-E factor negative regulatory protein RseA
MVQGREGREVADSMREALSALVDGEADAAGAADGVSRWRDDDDAKASWHAYQLIGDVLRSEDLAAGHRDRVFMQRLHARLIQEPTVLAPAPDMPQANPDGSHAVHAGMLHRWAVPLGLAAGVALVLGTLLVVRQGPLADGPVLADAKPGLSLPPAELAAVAGSSSAPVLLRDPRLDRYLAAHKQFQSANAMGPSTGFIRSATYDTATR